MKHIVLAGSSHRAAALKLGSVITAWAAAWCFLPEKSAASVSCEEAAGALLPERRLQSEQGDIVLALESGSWADAIFGAVSDLLPDDTLALTLLSSARDALLQDLSRSLAVSGRLTSDSHGTALLAAQHVLLAVPLNQSVLHIAIDAGLLPQEKKNAGAASLSTRQGAVSDAVVTLKVELPLMQVALEDFFGLKAGDIICGQSSLDTPFRVSAGGVSLPVSAALGAQGLHKAIKLDA